MLANQSLDPRYFAVWKALLRCADSKKYAICLEVAVSRLQPLLKFFTHCYSVPVSMCTVHYLTNFSLIFRA